MTDDERDRVLADAFRRITGGRPNAEAWELAGDDHVASGQRLRRLVHEGLADPPNKAALTRALRVAFTLASVINYYAHEGDGGVQSVMNDMESEVQAVDPDGAEGSLSRELDQMLALVDRGGWEVERRFPDYGWRLEERAKVVLAHIAVVRADHERPGRLPGPK